MRRPKEAFSPPEQVGEWERASLTSREGVIAAVDKGKADFWYQVFLLGVQTCFQKQSLFFLIILIEALFVNLGSMAVSKE